MMSTHRSRTLMRSAAAGVGIVLLAAACGGNSDGTSGSSSTGSASNLTKSEIKLGLLISKTGSSSSSDAPGADAATAWQEWVNANGGLNGHPVKMVVSDDKGDPATSVANAKAMAADTTILAITSQESNTEVAVSDVLKKENVAVVGATGYSPTIWGALPNYFSTAPAGFPTDVLAQFVSAKAVGATTWMAGDCAEVAACKATVPLRQPAATSMGLSYKGSLSISAAAPSYTAECLKVVKAGADFMQLAFSPDAAKRFINDCNAQGYEGWYGATAGSVSGVLTKIDGVRLAGGLHGFPWWGDEPAVAQYRDAMKEYAPDADYQTPSATAVWAALELIRKALATVSDSPTRQDVFSGLYGLHDEDLGGLLPQKMTYAQGKPAPQVMCLWIYRLEDGKFSSAALTGPSGNSVSSGTLKSDCVKPLG